MNDAHKVILGKFASVYGVKGWIKVVSYTDPIDNILKYPNLQVRHAGKWQPITVEKGKQHGKFIVMKLKGDDDRDKVKRFTNDEIAIARENLPELDTDQHYIDDLINIEVQTKEGVTLGKIIEIQETGANDIIIIESKEKKRHLIPYIDHVVTHIDTDTGIMTVDWDINWENDHD